jgi:hypothetical protein
MPHPPINWEAANKAAIESLMARYFQENGPEPNSGFYVETFCGDWVYARFDYAPASLPDFDIMWIVENKPEGVTAVEVCIGDEEFSFDFFFERPGTRNTTKE